MPEPTTPRRPTWPWIVSMMAWTLIIGILGMGLLDYERYRKSTQPDLSLDLDTLHFFSWEALQRRAQALTTKPLPEQTPFHSYYLFADEWDLAALESNLPTSAKRQFMAGHIRSDDNDFQSEMSFRYRGGLSLHWLYDKKSYRIKLPRFTLYRGGRSFNLVNPSTIETVVDWLSYQMSSEIGLLTPEYFPARVFMNDRYNGLHFYLDRIDESFLRKNRRMPGSIYSGDTIYVPNPFGGTQQNPREEIFVDDELQPLLWRDERLWSKDAARNAEKKDDREDIKAFIRIINEPDPVRFQDGFLSLFDAEKFYLFWGLDTLVGSFHHDNVHNHKIYFDPYLGRLEPIQWDVRFWTGLFTVKDLAVNPLVKQVTLNPILEAERDKVTWKLMSQFPSSLIQDRIDQAAQLVRPELLADPYRQHPEDGYKLFATDKTVPFSIGEFDRAINSLKHTYANRQKLLENIYQDARLAAAVEFSDQEWTLHLCASGNSPVEVDLWAAWPAELQAELSIARWHDGNYFGQVSSGKIETLYPGRQSVAGNFTGGGDSWAKRAFGDEMFETATLCYDFRIADATESRLQPNLEQLSAKNAITQAPAEVSVVAASALPSVNADSTHPWILQPPSDSHTTESVVISGDVTITEDREYAANERVVFEPGTTVQLGADVSLIFRGPVEIKGEAEKPVIFERLNLSKPWGSIVIHGQSASGTRLAHFVVKGGSKTRHQLVDYPGQLNIHDLANFSINNCWIGDNILGDDSLHIAYSDGVIKECVFERTAFDAIDIDIGRVSLNELLFRDIGNDALDLMTSIIKAQALSIDGAGDKCVSVGEASQLQLSNSQLDHCVIGIAVKDESKVEIRSVNFGQFSQSPIALYRKNPRYSVGGTIEGRNISGLDLSAVESDTSSRNLITRDDLTATER